MNELHWRDTDEAFARMQGGGGHRGPYLTAMCLLCGDGVLNLYEDTIGEVVSGDRASEHNIPSNKSSAGESVRHVNLKILACRYLDQHGHTLKTERVEGGTETGSEWRWDCFEEKAGFGFVDVACDCDDHTAAAEVGYVSPKQVVRAFGYSILGRKTDPDTILENLTRVRGSDLNAVITIPYNQDPDTDRSVYVFEATDELPDAEPARHSERIEDALGLE